MVEVRGVRMARAIVVQVLGWVLLLTGLAALVLPGPGLLLLLGGMAVLATQYEWAERRLEPVRKTAIRAAADSVSSGLRIVVSVAGVVLLVGVGVLCGVRPDPPSWWPLAERWWLPGGWGVGASLIVSGVVAGAMIAYSYLNFREIKHDEAADDGA